jgi:spore germination cell wall hydrolase CwlJ-like protein
MPQKTSDANSRSDRVLVVAMATILATASAAIGASMTNHPAPDKVAVAPRPVVQLVQAPSPATDVAMAQLLAEHKCLSEVLYYEARGEGAGGQKAIAEVVFHRMNHGDYGHSICAVVYEGKDRPGCQFSFTCNGEIRRPKQVAAWRESEKLATEILTGEMPLHNATGGALNFHAVSVSPGWAEAMNKTTQIGNHVFYRGMPRTHTS